MKKQSYPSLVRKHKPEAYDFVAEQESVVKLLNSPVRKNWLKVVGLDKKEVGRVLRLVDHYARLKVTLENRKKPKAKKDIIAVEDACLRLVFQAKVVGLHNLNTRFEKLKVLKNLLLVIPRSSAAIGIRGLLDMTNVRD